MTNVYLADTGSTHEGWPAMIERIRARATVLAATLNVNELLPHSMLDADFVPSAQLNVELFFRTTAVGAEPSEEDTRPIIDRALRLIHDGMSLDEILSNYRVGVDFFWTQLMALLQLDEYPLIPEFGRRLNNYVNLVMSRIATACVGDARRLRWEILERQGEIAADLLAGRDVSSWTDTPDIPIADAFLVAVIRLGEPTPGALTDLRTRISLVRGSFLHRDSGGWTALIPVSPTMGTDPVAALSDRLNLRDNTIHRGYWIGAAVAPTHAAVPGACAEASVVAETARALGRPGTVCARRDMMFEYSIAAGGTALIALAALLDPMADQPLLRETLDAYIDNQCNHNAAARVLFIHRNTVTSRLSRIADLTGYDPQLPTGVSTLMAARIARRLTAHSSRGRAPQPE